MLVLTLAILKNMKGLLDFKRTRFDTHTVYKTKQKRGKILTL